MSWRARLFGATKVAPSVKLMAASSSAGRCSRRTFFSASAISTRSVEGRLPRLDWRAAGGQAIGLWFPGVGYQACARRRVGVHEKCEALHRLNFWVGRAFGPKAGGGQNPKARLGSVSDIKIGLAGVRYDLIRTDEADVTACWRSHGGALTPSPGDPDQDAAVPLLGEMAGP